MTSSQRRLLFFLSVATFFEGFDVFALSQILPSIGAEFHLTPRGAGALVGFVNIGSLANSSTCRPSATVNAARALSGGNWAAARVGKMATIRTARARTGMRSLRRMI